MENTLHHVVDDNTERRTMSCIDAVLRINYQIIPIDAALNDPLILILYWLAIFYYLLN